MFGKKRERGKKLVNVNLLDVLLDENNSENIIMYNEKGNRLEFQQVAVIPYGEEDLYCILKPVTKIANIADNEAVVFQVVEDENGEAILRVEDKREIAEAIFEKFHKLLDENG